LSGKNRVKLDLGIQRGVGLMMGKELELELELIQTRMIQKPLQWVEVGKSACVLVGICEMCLSLPAGYSTEK
jgi:hypothetical protein